MQATKWIAKALSVLFHPLWIPTYAFLIVVWNIVSHPKSIQYLYAQYLSGTMRATLLWTLLVPVALLLLLLLTRRITSITLDNQQERTLPYWLTALSYMVWCYSLANQSVPLPLPWLLTAMGGTLALMLVAVINRYWRISAHATGMGALMGFVLTLGLQAPQLMENLTRTISVMAGINIAVMGARLYLNKHTSNQVLLGWFIGLICTVCSNFLLSIFPS